MGLILAGGLVLVTLMGGSPALAQAPRVGLPGAVEPGRDRPQVAPPSPAEFDFTVQSPRRAPIPRAVDELTFELRGVDVVGSTVFSREELAATWQSLLGQPVRLSDIVGVAEQIEQMYSSRGYILTRAFVPPQRIAGGVFQISIVEGYVGAVRVEGGGESSRQRIEGYLSDVAAERPVNSARMERALVLANDLPGMSASGLLRPSPDQPGASDLVVTLVETPYSVAFSSDNRGSSFNGPWTLGADAALTDRLGWGEQFAFGFSATPDFEEKLSGQFRYLQPIGTDGLLASFLASATHGKPGSTLRPFDVVTDSLALGPRLRYPLLRSRQLSLAIEGGLTYQEAKIDVLDASLSSDHWRVADLGVSLQQGAFLGGTTTLSLGIAKGLDILGASRSGSPSLSRVNARTDFVKFTGSLRRVQAIDGPFSALVSAYGQYSPDALLAGEEVTFGGYSIGRGYDPGAITGDWGIGGSFELRYDIRIDEFFIGGVQPYAFFDTAKVGQNKPTTPSPSDIYSTGAGVRVGVAERIDFGLELARTLNAVPGSDDGRLSTRILFNIVARL